jgi:hypothetical protein
MIFSRRAFPLGYGAGTGGGKEGWVIREEIEGCRGSCRLQRETQIGDKTVRKR